MQAEVQLMTPVEALSRGLRRTLVRDNRVELAELEEEVLQRGFKIGGMGIIMEGERIVMEVLDSPAVFAVPNSPRACRGLINLRGSLVPIFDLRKIFGGEGTSLNWILIVDRGEAAAGFVIDDLPVQIKLSATNRMANIPEIDSMVIEAISEAYQIGEMTYLMMDHKKLLEGLVN